MSALTDLGLAGLDDAVEIGRGGFGVVYRARQSSVGRLVAVKVLPVLSEGTTRRFERECRAMATLSTHPNIVVLYESGVSGMGRPYIVMEYVPGGTLAERVPMAWEQAVEVGVRLCGALETAHRAGIYHRDVKPENILMSSYGEPKLTDFGIAKVGDGSLSATGHITASLLHAAPEVLSGKAATVSTDVYSLASTLYALIMGRAAFASAVEEETLAPLLLRISTGAVPSLTAAGVPLAAGRVIEGAMAKAAADRPATVAEFGEQLIAAQAAIGIPATRMLIEGTHDAPSASAAGSPDATVAQDSPTRMLIEGTRVAPSASAAGSHNATVAQDPPTPPPPPVDGAGIGGRPPFRRRRTALAAAGGLVALVAVGVALAATRGGPASTPGPLPAATFHMTFTAVKADGHQLESALVGHPACLSDTVRLQRQDAAGFSRYPPPVSHGSGPKPGGGSPKGKPTAPTAVGAEPGIVVRRLPAAKVKVDNLPRGTYRFKAGGHTTPKTVCLAAHSKSAKIPASRTSSHSSSAGTNSTAPAGSYTSASSTKSGGTSHRTRLTLSAEPITTTPPALTTTPPATTTTPPALTTPAAPAAEITGSG